MDVNLGLQPRHFLVKETEFSDDGNYEVLSDLSRIRNRDEDGDELFATARLADVRIRFADERHAHTLGSPDVWKVLFGRDHWLHACIDPQQRWVHDAVRDVVEAGRLAESESGFVSSNSAPAGAATTKMRKGLRNLLLPDAHQAEAEYLWELWILGSKGRVPLSPTCPDVFASGSGIRRDLFEEPFAYKNEVELALHRFFVPILSTCPWHKKVGIPALSPSPSLGQSFCPLEHTQIVDLARMAASTLFRTHLFRTGIKIMDQHIIKSCEDVSTDTLVQTVAAFLINDADAARSEDGDRKSNYWLAKALVAVREHLCSSVRMLQKEQQGASWRIVHEDED